MNKHIELVKKWLADPKSVTQQELEDNRDVAYAAYDDAGYSAYRVYRAAYAATAYAADAAAADAAYWIKRYEELTK
jgi:hypothetical protein